MYLMIIRKYKKLTFVDANVAKIITRFSFEIRELLNNADKLDNIIEPLKDLDRLNTIVDILCPAKKAPYPVKRVTRRTTQPRNVAPICPLTGETRIPEINVKGFMINVPLVQ